MYTTPSPAACPDCGDADAPTVVTRAEGDGRRVRVRVCGCGRQSPIPAREQPGIACPACCDTRLGTTYTRQDQDGSTIRVKACRHCGRRIRTRERVESYDA